MPVVSLFIIKAAILLLLQKLLLQELLWTQELLLDLLPLHLNQSGGNPTLIVYSGGQIDRTAYILLLVE